MLEKITILRNELIEHRQNVHKRSVPEGFWQQVEELSKTVPPKDLARQIGIDYGHLKRRLGIQKKSKSKASSGPTFMGLPGTFNNEKSPVIEIEVAKNVVIKVYS